MKRIFLETSAINRAVELRIDATVLRAHLDAHGMHPVVGLHVVYELAATFLRLDRAMIGKGLFRFIRDLAPSFAPSTMALLRQEILKLRTNAAVLPFLAHMDQIATSFEINRLADGIFDSRARSFIEDREGKISREYPKVTGKYIERVKHVKAVRAQRGKSLPSFQHFCDVAVYFQHRWPNMIRDIFYGQVTAEEARELASRLRVFPAIRAALHSNLYLMFICIAHETIPGDDKLDDYRHLIDASYCDAVILYDEKARRAAPHVVPQLKVLSWDAVVGKDSGHDFPSALERERVGK